MSRFLPPGFGSDWIRTTVCEKPLKMPAASVLA
jgi:hypothetical protein